MPDDDFEAWFDENNFIDNAAADAYLTEVLDRLEDACNNSNKQSS